MVLVNEHYGREIFLETSLLAGHVAIELDLSNTSIHMVYISIPHLLCSIHLQFLEEFFLKSLMHVLTFYLLRTCKNLALACSKTWDHGRREVIGLSSSNTYEKKKKQAITYKTNPRKKMNEANSNYTYGRAIAI